MTAHFLRDDDLGYDERLAVLDLAAQMKVDRFGWRPLAGPKTVALIFDKPSTRTRVSFSVGVAELGGAPLVLDSAGTQIGRGESVEDTTRVLERQVAAIVWRTFEQSSLETMAAISGVPVVNSLSDRFHPCQVLADLMTVRERVGTLAGKTLAYFGDTSNNMAHSYLLGGAGSGMHVRLAGPAGCPPDPGVVEDARRLAAETGGSIAIGESAKHAAYGADVVATDTWSSMGSSPLTAREVVELREFRIDEALVGLANVGVVVLHCLPAYRGKEITHDVIEGENSAVWDEAENRLHVQKALLTHLLSPA